MLVTELKTGELANIDTETMRLIPNNCMYCGKPLSVNPTLTGLTCTDDYCPAKVSRRCVGFLKRVGYLGLGESAMRRFCADFGIQVPVQLYMMEESDLEDLDQDSAYYKRLIGLIETLNSHRAVTMSEYLAEAQMPSIQDSSADLLVQGYDNFESLLNDIEINGTDRIQAQLGIKKEDVSLRSVKIYEQLMENKANLLAPIQEGFVDIIEPDKSLPEVNLVISDSAGYEWQTKKDFIDFVNSKFADKFIFKFKSSLTKKTDILITAGSKNTSKVRKAMDYGIPIMEGGHFVELATKYDNLNDLVNG